MPRKPEKEVALAPLNEDTLRVLIDNHQRFRSFLKSRVENEADADELLQQSLSKAVEQGPESEKEESILAWFYRVLRNGLTDYYRSRASSDNKLKELAEEAQNGAFDFDLKAELCACMSKLLPTLKAEYAQVLKEVDLEEIAPSDVAAALGITRNTLDVRLHRARKALKTSLVRSCGTCTEHGCLDCTCG